MPFGKRRAGCEQSLDYMETDTPVCQKEKVMLWKSTAKMSGNGVHILNVCGPCELEPQMLGPRKDAEMPALKTIG